MNISPNRGPIAIKYYLKHQWDGGKTALRFGQDRFRTLVSIATDTSHRVILGKSGGQSFRQALSFLFGSSFFLQVTRTTIQSRQSSNFGKIRQRIAILSTELSTLERLKSRLKNQHITL